MNNITVEHLLELVSQIIPGSTYDYARPGANKARLISVDIASTKIQIARVSGDGTLTQSSIASDSLNTLASRIVEDTPISIDEALLNGGNQRSVIEALLLRTAEFYSCKVGRNKNIVWVPSRPHKIGEHLEINLSDLHPDSSFDSILDNIPELFAAYLKNEGKSEATIDRYVKQVPNNSEVQNIVQSIAGTTALFDVMDVAKLLQISQKVAAQDFDKKGGNMYSAGINAFAHFVSNLNLFQRHIEKGYDNKQLVWQKHPVPLPLQTIYYGAPGTGKSYKVNELTKGDDTVIRTTFHPDSDYASFVGCYKPVTKEDKPLMQVVADFATRQAISIPVLDSAGNTVYDTSITYQFTQQAFLKAYIQAWKKLKDFKPITTSSAVSMSGSASTPYKVSGKSGTHTSFNFASQNGATLSEDEQNRLLDVDNFGFPFEGLGNLGELHEKITVVVTDEPDEGQKRRKRYIEEIQFSAAQIRELYAKYDNIKNEEYRQKYGQEWEYALAALWKILNEIAQKLGKQLDELKDYKGDDVTITIDNSEGGYGSVNLLGLFDPNPDPTTQKKTIYLFKNNIGDKLWLLCAVYIHEMFHAYYDFCGISNDIPEIEEPIVECNTLCFLELFEGNGSPSYLDIVKQKRGCVAISYYGFGSYLFENRSLDWMKLYKEGWNNINENSDSVKQYINKYFPIYPFGDELDTMNLLYNVLKSQSETTQIPAEQQQYLVIEEINRGNCAQIFGDIFQLLDRGDEGFSEYPIEADEDIRKELKNELASSLSLYDPATRDYINNLYTDADGNPVTYEIDGKGTRVGTLEAILNGKILVLPCNLNLLATMNTSDQSLFPMDSAFKRRWDWEYVAITNAEKNWRIEIDDTTKIDWWTFLQSINMVIADLTSSEDKQLGYFFTKPDEFVEKDETKRSADAQRDLISAKRFVSKVIFYLWNDVFKDYGFEPKCCKDDAEKEVLYAKFYAENGKDINLDVLRRFFMKLKDENGNPLL